MTATDRIKMGTTIAWIAVFHGVWGGACAVDLVFRISGANRHEELIFGCAMWGCGLLLLCVSSILLALESRWLDVDQAERSE